MIGNIQDWLDAGGDHEEDYRIERRELAAERNRRYRPWSPEDGDDIESEDEDVT